jgi:hypothetical protein
MIGDEEPNGVYTGNNLGGSRKEDNPLTRFIGFDIPAAKVLRLNQPAPAIDRDIFRDILLLQDPPSTRCPIVEVWCSSICHSGTSRLPGSRAPPSLARGFNSSDH